MKWIYYLTTIVMIIYLIIYHTINFSCSFNFDKYRLKLTEKHSNKLISILQEPIFTYWDHVHSNYNNCDTLKLDDQSIQLCLEHSGSSTNKALNGKNITMWVFGRSSSSGADIGPQSNNIVFHHIVQTWWNNAIASITGSLCSEKLKL